MEIRYTRWPMQLLLRGLSHFLLWRKRRWERRAGPLVPPREPSRIGLFVSMDLLGGGVLISAVSKTLKEMYPRASICVVGERHRAGLLESFFKDHSWVDEVLYCPARREPKLREWLQFYPVLKARRFDMCVLSPNHGCVNSVFLYLFGVPVIVGASIPSVWPWHVGVENQFLTRSVTEAQMHGKAGVLLRFAQAYARTLTGREELELAALVPYLRFKDEALPPALADKTIVTIHPGGARNKRWPPERFAEIARLVIQQHDGAICILGGPPEAAHAERIVKAIAAASPNSAVFNACGASVNQTLTYLAHSTMFVGHGAAPMHLAVGLGVPVLALLSQREYDFAAPLNGGAQHCVLTREHLEDLSVSEVWAAMQRQSALAPPRIQSSAV